MQVQPHNGCICGNHDCPIAFGHCHCGCGKATLINKENSRSRGWVKGAPRNFLRGHSTRPGGNRGHSRPPCRFEIVDGEPCVWVPLTHGHWTIVFEKDYHLVKDWKWRYMQGYVSRWRKGGGVVFMHQVICPTVDGKEPDHHDRDRLNNRSDNLRPATRSQNCCNRQVQKNNVLRIKGISEKNGGFVARITLNWVTYWLGTFQTIELAVEARRQAEIKYHGEFRLKAA